MPKYNKYIPTSRLVQIIQLGKEDYGEHRVRTHCIHERVVVFQAEELSA
jgi:hypothetical protein